MTLLLDALFGRVPATRHGSSFLARLNAAMALYRSRTRLADLDAHMLADIGVTRAEAQDEANRPIWDAPHTWKA